jgi:hypothetical protein
VVILDANVNSCEFSLLERYVGDISAGIVMHIYQTQPSASLDSDIVGTSTATPLHRGTSLFFFTLIEDHLIFLFSLIYFV